MIPALDKVMKLLGVILVLFWTTCKNCHGAPGNAASVESLISSIQESFKDLSTRRDMWKDNYDTIRDIQNRDQAQLQQLIGVSMYAVPFLWAQYVAGVADEQRKYGKLYEGEDLQMPLSQSFDAQHPFFNVELHMVMHRNKVYHIKVKNSKRLMVEVVIDMEERKILMLDQTEGVLDEDLNERIKLSEETGDFPNIHPDEKTQVNIQVADDCVFTSFWWGDLNNAVPQWLGPTYHFCSQIYEIDGPETYEVIISHHNAGSDSANNSDELQNASSIAMTIYDGLKAF